jgi:hypothetical protein
MVVRRHLGFNDWRNALWKIVSNPAIEVMAIIAVVLLAAWVVVSTEVDSKKSLLPVPSAQGHL